MTYSVYIHNGSRKMFVNVTSYSFADGVLILYSDQTIVGMVSTVNIDYIEIY